MSEAERSDAELITAVRAGDELAYGQLWARHEAAAARLARQIANPSNADDLVSESFLRVLRALKDGGGPDGAFRPYLFSTLRRINIDAGRSYYQRVALTEDESDLDVEQADSAADVLAEDADSRAAWRAWESLPDSTRTLLWHLVIEEETPAQIAPILGTTPNGVSSRAVRAKERLRQAFLQQHLQDADSDECRRTRGRLGEYVRDALSTRDRAEVDEHLDGCAKCKAALFEIAELNQTLRVVIAPIILGGTVVAGKYLAGLGGVKVAAVVGGAGAAGAGHAHWLLWLRQLRNLSGAATAAVATGVLAAGTAAAFVVHGALASPAAKHPVAVAPPVSVASSPVPSRSPSPSPTPSSSPVVVVAPIPPAVQPTPTPTHTRPKVKPTHKSTPKATPKTTPTTAAPPPPPPPPPTTVTVAVELSITASPGYSEPSGIAVLSVPAGWALASPTVSADGSCVLDSATQFTCTMTNVVAGATTSLTLNFDVQATGPISDHQSKLALTYTDGNLYTDQSPFTKSVAINP